MHIQYCSLLLVIAMTVLLPRDIVAHSWMAPEQEVGKVNPIPISSQALKQGKEIFSNYCAYCHGINGEGLPTSKTGLTMTTPNLVKRLQTHSQGDFYWKVEQGRGEMPSFKGELTEKEIWSALLYIDSLARSHLGSGK